jgi:hypothetical protein
MTNPSVTYSFSNGVAADATQVNTNFQDLINGMTDGTKAFNIAAFTCTAITCSGAVDLNGTTAIKGWTDASAATAGDVGEVIVQSGAITDTSGSSTKGTETAVTNATITLGAGDWLVFAEIGFYAANSAGTSTLAITAKLYEDAGAVACQSAGAATSYGPTYVVIPLTYHAKLSGNKTYTVKFTGVDFSGTSTISSLHANPMGTETLPNIWAVRIR